ncbi:hypothetical protein LHP98_04330 [Rhodobacter sp. Har01]|uniref:DUF6778 family protein n=1 Tax=Rhodobacter sp. Har01 TaxID=2883999 RepID=UPI001D083A8C|nr:DUF6778 family protein [Rhodobacter sp. Har01]MCB6177355.1 hypothetical protein [Rhodobacter sp. Har01]
MRWSRAFAGIGLALALAGCGAVDGSIRTAAAPADEVAAEALVEVPLAVQDVTVTVPRSLKVSEAEVFYPVADIVWRGEPRGDRYAQIEAIYEAAVTAAVVPLTAGLPVVAEIEVTRFHAVTDKTRYTVGGVHSLKFLLTIRDAATGKVLSGPRLVNADVRAVGGQRAVRNDYVGISQKEIVTNRLATVIRAELASLKVAPALAATLTAVPAE